MKKCAVVLFAVVCTVLAACERSGDTDTHHGGEFKRKFLGEQP